MGLLEAVKAGTQWENFGLRLQFAYQLSSQTSGRSATQGVPQLHGGERASVTLLVWLLSQMIELSCLPDAGFCHVSSTDTFTKNTVLLALGIYTVNLRLTH